MGYTWAEDGEEATPSTSIAPDASDILSSPAFFSPPLSSATSKGATHSHHGTGPMHRPTLPAAPAPPHFRYPVRASICPGFPYHTVASVYLGNFLIMALATFALVTGVETLAAGSSNAARFRQLAMLIVGCLVGVYLVMHLATPVGVLDGFIGAIGITTILCFLGAAPLILFAEFREILHNTAQALLLGPHAIRVLHVLFLPLYDVSLVPFTFAATAGWGGLIIGLTAPVLAFMFGTKKPFAKGVAVVWTSLAVAQLLLLLMVEAWSIPEFIEEREQHRLGTGYIWHSVLLVVHYSVPLLLILHGYSIWKLVLDKAPRPTMLWQEEDDAELARLYGPDSPGSQDDHVGIFDPAPPKPSASSTQTYAAEATSSPASASVSGALANGTAQLSEAGKS